MLCVMRKFMIWVVIMVGTAFAVVSCIYVPEKIPTTTIKSSSFAFGFYPLQCIRASSPVEGQIRLYGEAVKDFIDTENHAELFKQLNASHGDNEWNQTVTYYNERPNVFFTPDLAKVEIVSDQDFDVGYPADSSLSDLVQFQTVTPFPYIQSGYKSLYDWDALAATQYSDYMDLWHLWPVYFGAALLQGQYFPVSKTASELTAADLTMIGRGRDQDWYTQKIIDEPLMAVINFTSQPTTSSKVHNMRVRLTDVNGKVYQSNEVKVTF